MFKVEKVESVELRIVRHNFVYIDSLHRQGESQCLDLSLGVCQDGYLRGL